MPRLLPAFVLLAVMTSTAAAEPVEILEQEQPRRDFYLGANLIAPTAMDEENGVSVEGGARLAGPLFAHVEAGTGFIVANAGLELRMCSRGRFFVCGGAGLDAAYTGIGPDTVARFTFELGTAVRFRIGIDVPKKLQATERTDGAYELQPQLKGGVAFVF